MEATLAKTATMAIIAAMLAGAMPAAEAAAQMFDRPWTFQNYNRGQMAIAMRQFDEAGAASGTGEATTIVCGGGSSTATANNTCIIMNNATGEILTDQTSDNSTQDATSTIDTTVNGETVTGADEVLSVLEGQ